MRLAIDPSKYKLTIYDGKRSFELKNNHASYKKIIEMKPQEVYIEGADTFTRQLVQLLIKHNIKVYEVPPRRSSKIREVIKQDKTDDIDVKAIYFLSEFEDLTIAIWKNYTLYEVMKMREHLVRMKNQMENRLHAVLLHSWGDYKKVFKGFNKWALRFLYRFPVPSDVDMDKVGEVLENVQRRYRGRIIQRLREYLEDYIPENDPELLDIYRMEIKFYVKYLEGIKSQIEVLEKMIKERTRGSVLWTFPGIGPVAVGAMEAVWRKGKFKSVHHFLAYCGLVPRRIQSGTMERTGKRKHVNNMVRNAFYRWAVSMVRNNEISRAYWQRKVREGKKKSTAFYALARQLAKICYRMKERGEGYRYEGN